MKRSWIICWLLPAMVAIALGLGGCSDEPATVRGVVSQAQDPNKPLDDPANAGQGIVQAEVRFFSLEKVPGGQGMAVYKKGAVVYTVTTDAEGAFSQSVDPGVYVIDVWVNSQKAATRQIEVKRGQNIKLTFNVPATP